VIGASVGACIVGVVSVGALVKCFSPSSSIAETAPSHNRTTKPKRLGICENEERSVSVTFQN
jgi:hypothetical protein